MDLVGPLVTEGGVSVGVGSCIEPLDIGDDIALGLRFRGVDGAVDAFIFQGGEEPLGLALSQDTPVRPAE